MYIHKRKDNNTIAYVGSGTADRYLQVNNRSSKWKEVNKEVGLEKTVYKDCLNKDEALILEQELITKLRPELNIVQTVAVTKKLSSVGFDEYLAYDETSSSCLRWIKTIYSGSNKASPKTKAGDEAGYLNTKGTWRIGFKGKVYSAHRIIMLFNGENIDDTDCVDHINGNPSDNRISNLRNVSFSVNSRNRKNAPSNTGYVGIIKTRIGYGRGSEKFNDYFLVRWTNIEHKEKTKKFNIKHFETEELALKTSIEYRALMITELNLQGAGYTERHGT